MGAMSITSSIDSGVAYSLEEAVKILEENIIGFFSPGGGEAREKGAVRFEIKVKPVNILSWLDVQCSDIKIYWAGRDNDFETGSIGRAHSIGGNTSVDHFSLVECMRRNLSEEYPGIRYYGGICFDADKQAPVWEGFGTCHFIMPMFELSSWNNDMCFACNIVPEADGGSGLMEVLEQLQSIATGEKGHKAGIPAPKQRRDQPEREEWDRIVRESTDSFKTGVYEKVVLARRSTFSFEEPLNPSEVINRLKQTASGCFLFGFQFKKGEVFLGASPERFYRRDGKRVTTEAVAGTRPRGLSMSEDEVLKKELLSSSKDLHEHSLVVKMIKDKLDPLCESLKVDAEPSLFRLRWGHHLFSGFECSLKDGVGDAELLSTLHPTPAVAGCPTERAMSEIRDKESFSRGWYAGPVGYIGHNDAELAVGIRSGLLRGRELSLYSGAGIVEGSVPEEEWNEIEHKLDGFLKIFE